mgnify:FL=1
MCGDSQKKVNKKRGYFYEKNNSIMYHCFNCDAQMFFSNFLKEFDPFLYKQYALESYKERSFLTSHLKPEPPQVNQIPKTSFKSNLTSNSIVDGLPKVIDLPSDHKAKKYLLSRKIPSEHLWMFRYTDTFFEWANSNTDKFDTGKPIKKDQQRIIMPWYDTEGGIFAYQARSINGEEPKYYTIIIDENVPKLFGIDRLNKTQPIFIVEGPIDSLFLPNCCAVGSSSLTNFDDTGTNTTYVFDAERRNPEIVKTINKAIRAGKKVFIPPISWKYKDLNDSIMDGIDPAYLLEFIKKHTAQGVMAQLKFNQWKRS